MLVWGAATAAASREHVFEFPQRSVSTLHTHVFLDVPHGSVHLEPSADDQLHVQGMKRITTEDRERAERLAKITELDVFEDASSCRVVVEIPGAPKRGFWDWVFGSRENVAVELRVQVPAHVSLHVLTVSADVFASGVSEALRVQTTSGDVQLLDVGARGAYVEVATGRVRVENALGPVTVEGADSNVTLRGIAGHCRVDLASGDLEAADLQRNIEVQTQSGDVRLLDLRGNLQLATGSGNAIVRNVRGDVRAHLAHGSLDLELEPRTGRYYEMTSRTGDLSVRLLGRAPFQLHARAPNGALQGSIPGMTYEHNTRHEIRGRVDASGGPHVHLRSDEGNVHVCCPARELSGGCHARKSRS